MRIKERPSRGAAAGAARATAPFAAAAAAAPSAAPTAAVAAGVIRLPGYSAWLEDGRPKPLKVFDHHSGRAIAAYKSAAGAHVAIMAARDPAALDEALSAHGAPVSPAKLAIPAQAANAVVAQPGHEQVAAAQAVGLAIGRNKQRQQQPLPLPPPSSQQQQRGQQQPAARGSAPRPRLGLKASLAAAGLSSVPSAAPALISPRAAARQLMPLNAPAERPMAPPPLPADKPKLGAMPAPASRPPQQRQPQDLAPPPAQAGSPAMQADAHAAAVPVPAAPSASRPPASTAAGQDAGRGSGSGSSTEQPALKSLISRLLGGKRQVQQPGELAHVQQRPSATMLKQPAKGKAAACGGSLAPAGQLGMPGGAELGEAGSTEEQGAAPAKRRRLKTEGTDDEEQQLRDRQAIAALFDSSSEEAEAPAATQHAQAGQPSEEGELPQTRDQLWQPSEEGELPCTRDQLWEAAPPAAAAPAPSASTATAVVAGPRGPVERQLSHEEQRVLAFFQAQPNQRATTAEFEAWASSVGLRVELCVVARSTLRQLGYLEPPTRLRKKRGWLWSLAGSGGSTGGGGTSGSPSGSSSSPPGGADTPTSSASLSSDSSGPAADSSTTIRSKPSQEPQQRQPAEAADVAEPQQLRRHRLAVEGESDSDEEDAVGGAEARATLRQHSSMHAGQALALPSAVAAAAFAAADAAASGAAAGHSGTSGAGGAAGSLPSTSLDGRRSEEPNQPAALAVPSTNIVQETAQRWQQQARLHAERWTEEQMAYKPEAWLEDAEQIGAVVQAAAALQLLTQQQRPAAAVKARQLELARRQQRQEMGGPGFEQPKVAQKAGGGQKAGKAAARPQKSGGHLKASVREKQQVSLLVQQPSASHPALAARHPKPAQAAAGLPRVQPTPEMLAMAARQLLAVSSQAGPALQLPQPPATQQVPLALTQASSPAFLMQFQALRAAAAALQMPQAAVAAPQPVQAVAGSPARQEAGQQVPAGASQPQLPAQLVGFPMLPQQAGAQHGMVPPMAALAAPMLLGQSAPAYLALLQQQMQALVMAQQAQAQQAQLPQQPGNALPLLLPMPGPLALGAPAAAPQQETTQHAAQQGQPQPAAGRQAQQLAAQGAPGEHAAGQHGEQ